MGAAAGAEAGAVAAEEACADAGAGAPAVDTPPAVAGAADGAGEGADTGAGAADGLREAGLLLVPGADVDAGAGAGAGAAAAPAAAAAAALGLLDPDDATGAGVVRPEGARDADAAAVEVFPLAAFVAADDDVVLLADVALTLLAGPWCAADADVAGP